MQIVSECLYRPLYTDPEKNNESLLAYFGNGHGKFHDIVLFLKYYFWFLHSVSTTQGHRVQNSQKLFVYSILILKSRSRQLN